MSYYNIIHKIDEQKIPISLELSCWHDMFEWLGNYLIRLSPKCFKEEANKAILIQIFIKIDRVLLDNERVSTKKSKKIKFTPAEKYAMEHIFKIEGVPAVRGYTVFFPQNIINQIHDFDTNNMTGILK